MDKFDYQLLRINGCASGEIRLINSEAGPWYKQYLENEMVSTANPAKATVQGGIAEVFYQQIIEKRTKLVNEAAKCGSQEEILDVFRSGWQSGLFLGCITDLMFEDLANACSETISDEARLSSARMVNQMISGAEEFQRFMRDVEEVRRQLEG